MTGAAIPSRRLLRLARSTAVFGIVGAAAFAMAGVWILVVDAGRWFPVALGLIGLSGSITTGAIGCLRWARAQAVMDQACCPDAA